VTFSFFRSKRADRIKLIASAGTSRDKVAPFARDVKEGSSAFYAIEKKDRGIKVEQRRVVRQIEKMPLMDTLLMAMKDRLTMQLPLKSYPRSPTIERRQE
jgi:hypothetical protein